MPTMQFGKYKGEDLSDVPTDYIEWLLEDDRKKVALYEGELNRRKMTFDHSFMNRIIKEGHAVVSGTITTLEAKAQLDHAFTLLEQAIKDAAGV